MSQTPSSAKVRLHEIVFEADTTAGKVFDLSVLVCIVVSVAAVMLESVASVRKQYGVELRALEWLFTVLFTIEYLLRLYAVRQPLSYAVSFFGLVDLCSVLPSYLSLFIAGSQTLLVVRALRLLRIFRVLKLGSFLGEAQVLMQALRASRAKITVFLGTVLVLTLLMGSLMYLLEGPEHGFSSIPRGVYWAVVTLTTVGYGDLSPKTDIGQTVAACVMIMGYGILAVPTGIVSVELAAAARTQRWTTQACPNCGQGGHDADAKHCKHCGAVL
ncbi:MAG TPA: ion transporter [Polyangiales bacterium]|nr:ion transporter [Polyangiales bacterium]